MKRAFVVSLIISLCFVSAAFASGTLTGDTYSSSAAKSTPQNGLGYLNVQSSGGVGCTTVNETFLKFNLSTINGEVSSATTPSVLQLTAIFDSGATATGTLELWSTDSTDNEDDWDEATLTYNSFKPDGDTLLATRDLPAVNGTVEFSSANLNTYLNEQTAYTGGGDTTNGDNVASFLIRISGCSAPSNQVFFAEGSPVSSYGAGPRLSLYGPNAVDIASMEANRSQAAWPLYAGLGAVALLVVAGLAISRRRTA